MYCFSRMSNTMTSNALDFTLDELSRCGYALVQDILSPATIAAVRLRLDAICEAERDNGTAWREPPAGQRVWMLLNKGSVFADLVRQPLAVRLADTLIGAPVLLSNATANVVGPGAAAQAMHSDQGYLPDSVDVPMVLTAIWLLDDFTEANGATRAVAGSHLDRTAAGSVASVTGCAGQGFVKVVGGVQPGESPVRSRNCRAWRGAWAARRAAGWGWGVAAVAGMREEVAVWGE